jgi:hypothetical protein
MSLFDLMFPNLEMATDAPPTTIHPISLFKPWLFNQEMKRSAERTWEPSVIYSKRVQLGLKSR